MSTAHFLLVCMTLCVVTSVQVDINTMRLLEQYGYLDKSTDTSDGATHDSRGVSATSRKARIESTDTAEGATHNSRGISAALRHVRLKSTEKANGATHDSKSVSAALREFQRFTGLPETGELDDATVIKLKSSRCGVPDVIEPSKRPSRLKRSPESQAPLGYRASGYKWSKNDLTFRINKFTEQIPRKDQLLAFNNALQSWSKVTPLKFKRLSSRNSKVDIGIAFGQRKHGDNTPFDGPGRVLAHAWYPAGTHWSSGNAHFDDEEEWTTNSTGINLEIVAAHEFGHSLGLAHSSNNKAIMAPYYVGYKDQHLSGYILHDDDIRGIQSLYGGCATIRFDAISQVHDGSVRAFSGNYVYTIIEQGAIDKQNISDVYPGAPDSPNAAVYSNITGKTYLFKGKRVWRFSEYTLDEGYPKVLPRGLWAVRAAFQFSNGTFCFFKRKQRYQHREEDGWQKVFKGWKIWKGFPNYIDSVYSTNDGSVYAFRGKKYWLFDSDGNLDSWNQGICEA